MSLQINKSFTNLRTFLLAYLLTYYSRHQSGFVQRLGTKDDVIEIFHYIFTKLQMQQNVDEGVDNSLKALHFSIKKTIVSSIRKY